MKLTCNSKNDRMMGSTPLRHLARKEKKKKKYG